MSLVKVALLVGSSLRNNWPTQSVSFGQQEANNDSGTFKHIYTLTHTYINAYSLAEYTRRLRSNVQRIIHDNSNTRVIVLFLKETSFHWVQFDGYLLRYNALYRCELDNPDDISYRMFKLCQNERDSPQGGTFTCSLNSRLTFLPPYLPARNIDSVDAPFSDQRWNR